METIRCGKCNRKLGEGEYTRLNIKCPRCGTLNQLKAIEPPKCAPRAPDTQEASHGTNL
ncbi:Com family DNA-binding transcriptional regulator [Zoogloea sp.]|uniref:Com family DNA-binding transcriptional regulator n=2 Tax=Zoogloea sp. TaxID=49181 RepID=UPI003418284A